jgi:hypothetical protein
MKPEGHLKVIEPPAQVSDIFFRLCRTEGYLIQVSPDVYYSVNTPTKPLPQDGIYASKTQVLLKRSFLRIMGDAATCNVPVILRSYSVPQYLLTRFYPEPDTALEVVDKNSESSLSKVGRIEPQDADPELFDLLNRVSTYIEKQYGIVLDITFTRGYIWIPRIEHPEYILNEVEARFTVALVVNTEGNLTDLWVGLYRFQATSPDGFTYTTLLAAITRSLKLCDLTVDIGKGD